MMAFGQEPGVVRFQSGPLANTTVTPFVAPIAAGEEVEWQGVEWFFQAWKTVDPELRQRIHQASSWREAKQLGQKVPLRAGWDTGEPVEGQTRIKIMLNGHRFKFQQHEESREALRLTGARWLVEARPDPFWGIGRDGNGPNWQGRCLMVVRDELFPDEPPF
jgi:ribA/ribD-fused uncharacterized protein